MILGVLAIIVIAPAVIVPLVNDTAARGVETRLRDVPLPAGAELVDSDAIAGKISGNGNGMQYLGALLIRGADGEGADALGEHFRVHGEAAGLSVSVTPAEQFEGFSRTDGFLARPGERGTFIVWAWGEGPGWFFEGFDIRGH